MPKEKFFKSITSHLSDDKINKAIAKDKKIKSIVKKLCEKRKEIKKQLKDIKVGDKLGKDLQSQLSILDGLITKGVKIIKNQKKSK